MSKKSTLFGGLMDSICDLIFLFFDLFLPRSLVKDTSTPTVNIYIYVCVCACVFLCPASVLD